jgi:SAM-dependent methyltransferase
MAPDYFDRYATRSWKWYAPLLANLVKYSAPGPMLDLGAGVGLLVEAATRWGIECTGLDGSADAVALGHERMPGIPLYQGFLEDPLPFEDERFQNVVLHEVIQYLPPERAASLLAEILRVLRPEGALYVASTTRRKRVEHVRDWMHPYEPKQLAGLLHRTGFDALRPLNTPLQIFGDSRIGRFAALGLYRLAPLDILSASATFIAYRPAN